MKRVLIVVLLVLAGCIPPPQVATISQVEEKPEEKIVEKVLVQCWDNSTAVSVDECPRNEAKPVVRTAPQNITPARQLLEAARSRFTGSAFLMDDRVVIVLGNRSRHMFLRLSKLQNETPITDVYVDSEKRTAEAYCNIDREADLLDEAFDYERSRCKQYVDVAIPVKFEEWVPRGPVEFLEDFADVEPVLVENNVQTVSIGGSSRSIQPSLHYIVNGKRVVLRIDKRYHVPIKIEREGERSVDFRDAFFDFMVVDGRQYKITPDWVVYKNVSGFWSKGGAK